MKYKIVLLILILLLSIKIYCNEDCTLVIDNVSIDNSEYSFDIYITRNPSWTEYTGLGLAFGIFHSTLVLNISNNTFSNPQTSNYGVLIDSARQCMPSSSKLSIELFENGTPVPITSSKLLNVCLNIINPDTTAGLSWDSINCVIFKSDNVSPASTDLIGYDNSSLPINNQYEYNYNFYDKIMSFPNPFGMSSSTTEINFIINKRALAEIKIYNIRGQLVRNLYKDIVEKDIVLNIIWDGKDDEGNILPSGIYLNNLKINNKPYKTNRLMIMR